jgi:hypothetical protein
MRPTITDLKGIGDFQPAYTWDLAFIQFPYALDSPVSSEDLNIRCTSSGTPKRADDPININVRGHKIHQTGVCSYNGSISLQFLEGVDQLITQFIWEWQELCWKTRTGEAVPQADLEATIQLTRLDRENNPVRVFTLYYVTIADADTGEFSSSGDTVKPGITLRYDYFEESNTDAISNVVRGIGTSLNAIKRTARKVLSLF